MIFARLSKRPTRTPAALEKPNLRHSWLRLAAGLVFALSASSCWYQTDGGGDDDAQTQRSVATFLGAGETKGFTRAVAVRELLFPQDHGAHPDYKHEWWYVTGNVDTDAGKHFGFQLTFFRIALSSQTFERKSAWAANQIYMAHFSVSDVASGRFYFFERFSRAAAGLAGASASPLRIWLEDWVLEEGARNVASDSALRLRVQAAQDDVAIDLKLESTKPLVLHGERGLSRKSATPGNASYYYSATRLRSAGSIRIGRQNYSVSGTSWLDREWSTSALDRDQVGWDWFALQLDDGRELMVYRLRRSDGGADPFSQGTLVAADGSSRVLKLRDIVLEVRDHWRSPRSGVRYPARWRLHLPQQDLQLDIEPYLPNQELNAAVRYWEGAVKVSGNSRGAPISGNGYVELVGYEGLAAGG